MIVVYALTSDQSRMPDILEIVKSPRLLMGYTLDSKFYHKHWDIIEHYEDNLTDFEFPYFRLGSPSGELFLIDHNGNKIRKCSNAEFNKLTYKTEIAPATYENALKALNGIGNWKEHYDKIKIDNLLAGRHYIDSEFANE